MEGWGLADGCLDAWAVSHWIVDGGWADGRKMVVEWVDGMGWEVTLYCGIRVLDVSVVTSFLALVIGGAGLTGLGIRN